MTTPAATRATDTAQPQGPAEMPPELLAAGWKIVRPLGKKTGGGYRAKNDTKALYSAPYPTVAEAIAAARDLDAGKLDSFDGTKTIFTPTTVPVSCIRDDGGTQPRAELDTRTLEEYAAAFRAGDYDKFPPIELFLDGKNYWLADGFHRFVAFRTVFTSGKMNANVRPGTQRDAVLFSLGANGRHGLPRSPEDKRRAVERLLTDPEWSQWSDNLIAAKADVSQPFVSKLRRELVSKNVLREPTKRRGKDNVVRETKNIGRKAPAPRPRTIEAVVADKGTMSRLELEDAGFSSAEITTAVAAGKIAQPAIGTYTTAAAAAPVPKLERNQKAMSIEPRLKGRTLALGFVWLPAVKGKVSVSVNATGKPHLATRKLIDASRLQIFPAEVTALIDEQLRQKTPAPTAKKTKPAKAKPKAASRPARSTNLSRRDISKKTRAARTKARRK